MLPIFWTQETGNCRSPFSWVWEEDTPEHHALPRASGVSLNAGGKKKRKYMTNKLSALVVIAALAGLPLFMPCLAPAGEVPPTSEYRVLAPIRHGNLTVFPVVAAMSHDTRGFITLDEGLRSGEVVVTESGSAQPLVRRRPVAIPPGSAQV